MKLEDAILYLECLFVNDFDVTYFNIEEQLGFIYIFIVKEDFKHYSISERIYSIFELLKFDCPEILTQFPVIVEAFDDYELQEMMKNARKLITR